MAIYTLFIQHVVNSVKQNGKGAIVVPTGFITAKNGIEHNILEYIVKNHLIYGVISMPPNIFANTGTNVSVLFFNRSKKSDNDEVIMIDASRMGEEYKDSNKLKKRRLLSEEIKKITNTFINNKQIDEFSAIKSYKEISENNYCLAPAQYFEINKEKVEISKEEFNEKLENFNKEFLKLFGDSNNLEKKIISNLKKMKLE